MMTYLSYAYKRQGIIELTARVACFWMFDSPWNNLSLVKFNLLNPDWETAYGHHMTDD